MTIFLSGLDLANILVCMWDLVRHGAGSFRLGFVDPLDESLISRLIRETCSTSDEEISSDKVPRLARQI